MKQVPEIDAVHAAIAELQRLADLFRVRRAQLAARGGLSEQQWHVLETIDGAEERFMPSMFARSHERSAPAVSRVLRQLQDKGLVSASVGTDDGRHRRYALTARGRKVLAGLHARRREAIDAVWMDLDPKALAAFTAFSRELTGRLEALASRERKGES
jgi:DNA-binding MarR family transcriptional regulator